MATFSADFPDDWVETEEEGITVYGGRGVAEALGAMLVKHGYKVSEPEHMFEHGWDFYANGQDLEVWFEVCEIEEFLLQTADNSAIWRKLLGRTRKPYEELLSRLHAEMSADPRFSGIRWHHPRAYDQTPEGGGAEAPVGA